MNHSLLIGLVVLVVVGYLVFANFRFLQTLSLIAQVSPYEQEGSGQRVLVLGDSTGYGTGARDVQETVAGRLGADFPELTIVNRSVNGDTIADATERLQNIDGDFDFILLQLGGNDVLQGRSQTLIAQDISNLYEQLSTRTAHIIMMSFGNVGTAPAFSGEQAEHYQQASVAFHTLMEEFAAKRDNFTYVNLYNEPSEDLFVQQPDVHMSYDGLHPSGAGYGLWYQKLEAVIVQFPGLVK